MKTLSKEEVIKLLDTLINSSTPIGVVDVVTVSGVEWVKRCINSGYCDITVMKKIIV